MKLFFAWCCVAVAVGAIALLISFAKDCKQQSEGFLEFILN